MARTLLSLLLTGWCLTGCQNPDTPSGERAGPPVAVGIYLASEAVTAGYVVMIDPDGATLYVDPQAIVTEQDIVAAEPVTDADHDGVLVTFGAAAAGRLREVTATHLDKPLAIKVNGRVIAVPVVHSAFGEQALLTGDLSPMTPAELASSLAPTTPTP